MVKCFKVPNNRGAQISNRVGSRKNPDIGKFVVSGKLKLITCKWEYILKT